MNRAGVKRFLACVESVSVGFSACLKHFLFFGRAKIGASIAPKISPSPQLSRG